MKRRITKLLSLCLMACLMLTACGGTTKTTEFSCDGLTMTVPADYRQMTGEEVQAYTFALTNNKTILMGLREEKAIFRSFGMELTLDDYMQIIREANQQEMTVDTYNGQYMIKFESVVEGNRFKYLASVYESEDAFWLIQFGCPESDFEDFRGDFFEQLLSVKP